MDNKYLIVGLGNPGAKYVGTRHNVGFDFIELVAKENNVNLVDTKFESKLGKYKYRDKTVYLCMPMTYMNLSGKAVSKIANYYDISSKNIIICYDDIYLDVGKLRIRKNGSAGGHNGMKSIISLLGTMDFPRIRIGVGKKPEKIDLADYVLSRFLKEECNLIDTGIENAIEALPLLLDNNILEAMNRYN